MRSRSLRRTIAPKTSALARPHPSPLLLDQGCRLRAIQGATEYRSSGVALPAARPAPPPPLPAPTRLGASSPTTCTSGTAPAEAAQHRRLPNSSSSPPYPDVSTARGSPCAVRCPARRAAPRTRQRAVRARARSGASS